jgi:hypothetical protein
VAEHIVTEQEAAQLAVTPKLASPEQVADLATYVGQRVQRTHQDALLERLEEFYVDVHPDIYPDGDDALVHTPCNAVVCTVEDGDTLGLLARTVLGHLSTCTAHQGARP